MKVSKKIFIIFSMILLLVSPVTSLGKYGAQNETYIED